MKMKLRGAKLNKYDTIKVIRKCAGGIYKRSWGDLWAWLVNEVLQHSPKKLRGAQSVAKAPSLPLGRATSRVTQHRQHLFHRRGNPKERMQLLKENQDTGRAF